MSKTKFVSILVALSIWNGFGAGSTLSTNPQNLTPLSQKALAEANQRQAAHRKCDSTYGEEIRKRTGDLQRKMFDLAEKERKAAFDKRKTNQNLSILQNKLMKIREKENVAYKDTSSNRIKLRKDVEIERQNTIMELQDAERKADKDPDLMKLRLDQAKIRAQIDSVITEIVKNDEVCRGCYLGKK